MRIGHQTHFRGAAGAARTTHERRPRRQTRRRLDRGAPAGAPRALRSLARVRRRAHPRARGRAGAPDRGAGGAPGAAARGRLDGHRDLHGDPGAGAAEHLRAARLRAARGPPRPLDGVLLRGHGALARRRPGARDRRRQLLRHPRADVGLHDRLPDPEPGPQPVRRRRDPGRVRAGVPGEARAGGPPRGIPARLAADPAGDGGAGSAHRGVRAGGAGPGADLRPGVRGRAAGPDGHPLADPVPDPDPARGNRDGRRRPQQRRPLRGVRDLALLLERGDHRRAGGAGAHLLRGGPDLRVRDRRAGRHRDPARDPRLGPAQHQVRRARPLPDDLALPPPHQRPT